MQTGVSPAFKWKRRRTVLTIMMTTRAQRNKTYRVQTHFWNLITLTEELKAIQAKVHVLEQSSPFRTLTKLFQ